jgi:hypothetical protein
MVLLYDTFVKEKFCLMSSPSGKFRGVRSL